MDVLVAAGNGNLLIYGVIAVILYKILHIHMPKDDRWKSPEGNIFRTLISIAVFAVSNMSYVNVNTHLQADILLK